MGMYCMLAQGGVSLMKSENRDIEVHMPLGLIKRYA
jgi:hypothetical protein